MDYKHGYLLVGDTEKGYDKALEMALDILSIGKDNIFVNPDFSLFDVDNFTIGNARKIKEDSAKKSFHGKGRVFVIKTDSFTGEACNALLKTFEEPVGLSYFFVVTSSPENILETLYSRLVVLTFEREQWVSKEKEDFVLKFIKAGVDSRLKMIEKIMTDKIKAQKFLDSLEVCLKEKKGDGFDKEVVGALDEVLAQKINLAQRASVPKIILEYICLALPSGMVLLK